jgi:hypothetical protein
MQVAWYRKVRRYMNARDSARSLTSYLLLDSSLVLFVELTSCKI